MSVVTPEEIAVALGRPTPTELDRAQWLVWIGDAEILIEDRMGDLAALDQKRLAYVIRNAVSAMVQRPDSATQVDVAVDDGRVSKRYSSSTGKVTILDDWWDLLTTVSDSAAFTIRPAFEPDL